MSAVAAVLVILASLTVAAAGSVLLTPLAAPPGPDPLAGNYLVLESRVDDPAAGVIASDVETGNADPDPTNMEIIRVGADISGGLPFPNITAQRFSSGAVWTNLSGFQPLRPGWFNAVAIDELIPGPAPQMVAVGDMLDLATGGTNGTVAIYQMFSPVSEMVWDYLPPANEGGQVHFNDVATGEIHLSHPGIEFIVAGEHRRNLQPYDSQGLIYLAGWTGSPFINTLFIGEYSGSWLYYNSVAVADLDPLSPGNEIVLVGKRNNASFISVANYSQTCCAGFRFMGNHTYNNLAESELTSVQLADVDFDDQLDIVVGGYESTCVDPCQGDTNRSRVSIWGWNFTSKQIYPKFNRQWTGALVDAKVRDVEALDYNGDGLPEIASIGYNRTGSSGPDMLGELVLMDNKLIVLDTMQWPGSDIDHWGLDSNDVDGDGKMELVTVGFKTTGTTTIGQQQVVQVPELDAMAVAVLLLIAGAVVLNKRLHRQRAWLSRNNPATPA